MKSRLKSEEGITLVELLASIAILSIVILLLGSVHIFGQTQFNSQTESAGQSNDLRYSLSVISRDVRQEGSVEKDKENPSVYNIGELKYSFEKPNLYRNGERLSKRIEHFEIISTNNHAEITIRSTSNRQSQNESYHTTIYFRR